MTSKSGPLGPTSQHPVPATCYQEGIPQPPQPAARATTSNAILATLDRDRRGDSACSGGEIMMVRDADLERPAGPWTGTARRHRMQTNGTLCRGNGTSRCSATNAVTGWRPQIEGPGAAERRPRCRQRGRQPAAATPGPRPLSRRLARQPDAADRDRSNVCNRLNAGRGADWSCWRIGLASCDGAGHSRERACTSWRRIPRRRAMRLGFTVEEGGLAVDAPAAGGPGAGVPASIRFDVFREMAAMAARRRRRSELCLHALRQALATRR